MTGLLQRLGALLQLRLETRLRHDRVGLGVQPLGQAADLIDVRQGIITCGAETSLNY